MIPWETGKMEYTEAEAATALGVSVEELRALERQHVTKDDQDGETSIPTLRQTDLLALKIFSQQQRSAVA